MSPLRDNEGSGLTSFGTDWFDLLAVLGTLKSLLQHHSSKASILWHSAFFILIHSSVNGHEFEQTPRDREGQGSLGVLKSMESHPEQSRVHVVWGLPLCLWAP